MMFGTRPKAGGRDAMPARGAVLDLVYGAPYRVARTPWPRTRTLVAATSDALHARMLEDLAAGLVLTGQTMPGPIPGDEEKDRP
jgi:1-acyl-sn-glycerol-3-phosphate acyltransferase